MSVIRCAPILCLSAAVCTATTAIAQDAPPNPAHAVERANPDNQPSADDHATTITWGLPPIDVEAGSDLVEEERIGAYGQPRWTARRRFASTRVYVRPAGEVDFEYWYLPEFTFGESDVTTQSQFEFEFGLGHRLQMDLYLVTEQDGTEAPIELAKEKLELRYALANWGVIWGNPTLYLEYNRAHSGASAIEGKVLIGGELAEGWHGGLNLVLEHQIGAGVENEYAVTAGISRTIRDASFSLGAEVKLEAVDVENARFDFVKTEILAGPSLQWFPLERAHVDFVPLFGEVTEDVGGGRSETVAVFEPQLIVGVEL